MTIISAGTFTNVILPSLYTNNGTILECQAQSDIDNVLSSSQHLHLNGHITLGFRPSHSEMTTQP